jgi:hypothetical protein
VAGCEEVFFDLGSWLVYTNLGLGLDLDLLGVECALQDLELVGLEFECMFCCTGWRIR